MSGKLHDVLVVMGLSDEGDAGLSEVTLKCFASSMGDEEAIRVCFERAVKRSPVAATVAKACDLRFRFAVV